VEGLVAFRGAKYVQSVTGDTFAQAKEILQKGRKVLYSGTPCQIAGLKTFLQKRYDNLFVVDFVCHGVPSPLVWKKYLGEIIGMSPSSAHATYITNIKFRDKIYGWKNNHFSILSNDNFFLIAQNSTENSYLKGFLRDLYLRPSCHNCSFKSFKSGSDITIGDYWGIQNIQPKFDDDKGVSLVMLNTEKGRNVYSLLCKDDRETTYVEALIGNPCIEKSVLPHKDRTLFFYSFYNEPIILLINKLTAVPLFVRIKQLTVALLSQLGLLIFIRSLLKKEAGYS